jgi:hypothetical protein
MAFLQVADSPNYKHKNAQTTTAEGDKCTFIWCTFIWLKGTEGQPIGSYVEQHIAADEPSWTT